MQAGLPGPQAQALQAGQGRVQVAPAVALREEAPKVVNGLNPVRADATDGAPKSSQGRQASSGGGAAVPVRAGQVSAPAAPSDAASRHHDATARPEPVRALAAWLGFHAWLWTLLPPLPRWTASDIAPHGLAFTADHRSLVTVDRETVSVFDVATGRRFPISQDLGSGAAGCHLDAAGLAAAAAAFSEASAGRADLVIVNRLGKQEAIGEGLRREIADALLAGLPLLIAVRSDFLPAWREFAGDDWLELPPDEEAVERWALSVTAVAA